MHDPDGIYYHDHGDGVIHAHSHADGRGHTHSHTQTKAVVNRLARAIGHLESVKRMVEDGRDCSEVLIQLAAVNGALSSAGKEIIGGYLEECLQDVLEHGDTGQLEEFKETLNRFSG